MKKTILMTLSFLVLISALHSQNGNIMIDLGEMASKTTHSHNEWLDNNKYSTTEGSMYLNDDFRLGSMILNSDTLIEGIKYRLNIFTQQMEMLINKDTLALVKPEKIKNIYFDYKSFIYTAYEEDSKIGTDYFQVLSEGKYNLLIHYKVIFVPKNPPPTPLSAGNPNNEFVQFKYYFYQQGKQPALLLSKKSKNILNLFDDKKTEVNQYIKEKHLKTSNEKDLVEIFNFYNSLK